MCVLLRVYKKIKNLEKNNNACYSSRAIRRSVCSRFAALPLFTYMSPLYETRRSHNNLKSVPNRILHSAILLTSTFRCMILKCSFFPRFHVIDGHRHYARPFCFTYFLDDISFIAKCFLNIVWA